MTEFNLKSRELSPEIYRQFRTALEIGKWPDGRKVDAAQKQTLMEAVILYENANIPESDRVGYVEDKCQSDSEHDKNKPAELKWQ